jgi:hypothetical protein
MPVGQIHYRVVGGLSCGSLVTAGCSRRCCAGTSRSSCPGAVWSGLPAIVSRPRVGRLQSCRVGVGHSLITGGFPLYRRAGSTWRLLR